MVPKQKSRATPTGPEATDEGLESTKPSYGSRAIARGPEATGEGPERGIRKGSGIDGQEPKESCKK